MSYYKTKFTLIGANPTTIRTINIPSSISFHRLHEIIQIIFGFTDYHMYAFSFMNNEYIQGYDKQNNPENLTIDEYFDEFQEIGYEYDFGDGWLIRINILEKINKTLPIPELLEIKGRYNPVEDCGGVVRFNQILIAKKNKEDLHLYLDDVSDLKSANRHNMQNQLRVLFGYEELQREPKKINPKNTLDKYLS